MRLFLSIICAFVMLSTSAFALDCRTCHASPVVEKVPAGAVTTTTTKTTGARKVTTTTTTGPKIDPRTLLPGQAVTNSYKYINLREKTNRNDHPTIDEFFRYVGLDNKVQFKKTGAGYPWCTAFVVYQYKEAADYLKVPQPLPKTAGVANLWRLAKENPIRYSTFTVDQVRLGLIKLQPGDLPIWKNGATKAAFITGHIGLTLEQLNNTKLKTIEGNTLPETSGQSGNQRDGGGVYIRNRYLSPGNFYILGFVRVKG